MDRVGEKYVCGKQTEIDLEPQKVMGNRKDYAIVTDAPRGCGLILVSAKPFP